MGNTNAILVVGDHWRGRPTSDPTQIDPFPGAVDPLLGIRFTLLAPPATDVAVGMMFRTATSGVVGRILRVITTTSFVGEYIGVAGVMMVPNEVVTFEESDGTTFTGNVTIAQFGVDHALYGQPGLRRQDAEINTPIPDDKSDSTFWDRRATFGRQIVLDATTVSGGAITAYAPGVRCTSSSGASFFILLGSTNGSGDRECTIFSLVGTISDGDTITVQPGGTITCDVKTGGAGTPISPGAWVAHHHVPRQNGTAVGFEVPPNGNASDGGEAHLGQELLLLRGAHEFYKQKTDVNDRGVRLIPFDAHDYYDAPVDANLGGVTVQCVVCSGTVPTGWEKGETVTDGGTWSAKVHHWRSVGADQFVYVTETNGETLTPGTITGGTSGETATAVECRGYQKGSAFWNDLVGEIVVANLKSGALYNSQPRKWRGIFLNIWDSEVLTFANSRGCPWASFAETRSAWQKFINDLREHLGEDDTLQVALWNGDARFHANTAEQSGYAYSAFLQVILASVQDTVPGVKLVRTEGHELAQTTPLPRLTTGTRHRPDDYLDDGELAWRVMQLGLITPSGDWKYCPLYLVAASQSQQVGDIPAASMFAIDRNPDLWPSASFPTVSTVDSNVITWNTITKQWEPLDVAVNGNHFFGMNVGTAGPPVSMISRAKGRFAEDGAYSGVVGLINLPVSASSVNSLSFGANASFGAGATWDVSPQNFTTIAQCTVTVLPASGLLPARGRFTATAGTFDAWVIGAPIVVKGSQLGLQGALGNNSLSYSPNSVLDIASDGSYVDLVGTFVAEGPRQFTLEHGPLPIMQAAKDEINLAFADLARLKLIAWPAAAVYEIGESDLGPLAGQFETKLEECVEEISAAFGKRPKGQTPIAEAFVQLSKNTPLGSDADVETIRAGMAAVASRRPNAVVVDPSDLPMEVLVGQWPRTSRQQNGVHRTAFGHIMAGFRIDAALGTLQGIPAHPSGDVAVDYGSIDGGFASNDNGTDEGVSSSSETASSTDSAAAVSVSSMEAIIAEIDKALSGSADVASYVVNGQTVTLRSLTDMLKARQFYASQINQARGLRRTRVQF